MALDIIRSMSAQDFRLKSEHHSHCHSTIFREGEYLILKDGAELPDRCWITNLPVFADGQRRKFRVTWAPSWILFVMTFFFFFGLAEGMLGLLLGLILLVCFQKTAVITYSQSHDILRKKRRKLWQGAALILFGAALLIAPFLDLIPVSHASISFKAAIAFFIGCLVLCTTAEPLKAVKTKDGWFKVKGCSPAFLDSLPAMENSPF
ncbi:MAG: hypothetical protein QM680_02390 [Luteolibacter sp.]